MVPEVRFVIEVNTMDHHLHILTAYVDSKFTGKRDLKLVIFSVLVTVTIGFIWLNNASYLGW
jgi:sugar phosphate permease